MNIHTQQIDQTVHSMESDIAMLAQRTGPIVVCTGRSQSPPCGKQLQQRRRSLAPLRRPQLLALVLHRAPPLVEGDIERVVKPLVAVLHLVAVCAAGQAMSTLAE